MGRIRRYRSADAVACSELILQALDHLEGTPSAEHARVRARNTPRTLDEEMTGGLGQVYEGEDGIGGLALLIGERLDRLYVAPSKQGQGIGVALVSEMSRLTVRNGGSRLVVDSWPSAVSYYESLGFIATKTCGGADLSPCVRLEKALASPPQPGPVRS